MEEEGEGEGEKDFDWFSNEGEEEKEEEEEEEGRRERIILADLVTLTVGIMCLGDQSSTHCFNSLKLECSLVGRGEGNEKMKK